MKSLEGEYLHKDTDFIEVTEWQNGEGYDVATDKGVTPYTYTEIEAMFHLASFLEHRLIQEVNNG